mmetsp:Transcript_23774/g.55389  ORF Transcript_23774/g.55389 Transcript_23774/m.55389 type:complete len:213 (+) Transcript_23774:71-709(+)
MAAGKGGVPMRSTQQTKGPAKEAPKKSGSRMRPGDRRRFMSDKVSAIHSGPRLEQPRSRKRSKGTDEDEKLENSNEFKSIIRNVWDFVSPEVSKSARKQHSEAKIRALGGTPDKPIKMPYNVLKERQKKDKAQQKEKLEEDKFLGVSTSVSKHLNIRGVDQLLRSRKASAKTKKTRADSNRQMSLGMGAKESRGLAIIPGHALRTLGKRQQR